MKQENVDMLSPDKPLEDPKYDRLGYAKFAADLAESICKMAPPEGLVEAIYGSWGSGKSTVLNFVEHDLKKRPKSERPIIVRFNPWWFSGHEDLTRSFFEQLLVMLSKRGPETEELRNRIADFANAVSETGIHYAWIWKIGSVLLSWKRKEVPELKKKAEDVLKNQKTKILLIIDDIDRLTTEEIRDLFRLIKAVGDLPNIVYLLAFDRKVVVEALKRMQGISGEDYLEKIVQVPFELPLPDKDSLRRLLFEKLNEILADSPEELFKQSYWADVYFQGIDHFITTPRDIVHLTNTLSVTYPIVKGEVNCVDFIAVESLRVFCASVYDIIRKNQYWFAGRFDSISNVHPRQEDLRKFHNSWLEKVEEEYREPMRSLLMYIFPKIEAIWRGRQYGTGAESRWRKERRVCSPDIFRTYFRLAIPEGGISNAEMNAILALSGDHRAFGEKLIELAGQKRPDGTTRVGPFLQLIQDYTDKDITSENIPSIVKALLDVGDKLLRPEDKPRGFLDFGNDFKIWAITRQLLRRLEKSQRFDCLKEGISKGAAISMIVIAVVELGRQYGKYIEKEPLPEEEILVSSDHLERLESLALEKVRDFSQREDLLNATHLAGILRHWKDWAGENEPRRWLQRVIKTDKGLVQILERFLKEGYIERGPDIMGEILYTFDPSLLEPFAKPSQIIERVRKIEEKNWLTEKQRIAAKKFIQGYEMMKQGKDPSNTWAWDDE